MIISRGGGRRGGRFLIYYYIMCFYFEAMANAKVRLLVQGLFGLFASKGWAQGFIVRLLPRLWFVFLSYSFLFVF